MRASAYANRTKLAKSGGLEKKRQERANFGPRRHAAVRRFVRKARGYWASARARKQRRTLLAKGLAEDRNPDTNILLRLPRTLSQSYGVLVGRPDIDPPRCRYDSKVSTRSDQHALPASLFPSGTESALCSLARASITAQSRTGAPPRQDWAMRSSSASSARR